jgi:hypothetical protein
VQGSWGADQVLQGPEQAMAEGSRAAVAMVPVAAAEGWHEWVRPSKD